MATTVGVHGVIGSAFTPLESEIRAAFVYSSVARKTERASSDVDLMVLGNLEFYEILQL